MVLDGELYNHKLRDDFNTICSLAKKTKPTAQDLVDSEKLIQFWWYDICDAELPFGDRIVRMTRWYDLYRFYDREYIMPVETYYCVDILQLDSYYEKFLEEGYEGQMVRLNMPYEFKRSANLLKRKEFDDSEFDTLDIIEGVGNRAGMAGYTCHITKDGKPFKSNVKGDRKFLIDLLKNKDQYINKQKATIVHFKLTPDGIPRFPFVHSFSKHE